MRGQVRWETDGPRATITIDRPGKLNAMTGPMWDELTRLVRAAGTGHDVRVILLRGTGGVFSAGADLAELLAATAGRAQARRYCHSIVRALVTIATSPIPTIAVLDGLASGGGVELAIAADHRVGTPAASMQLPFASLGVVPDALTLHRLRGLAGASFAQWMIVRGDPVDAHTCRDRGLLDELVAAGDLDALLGGLTARLAAMSPTLVAAIRRRPVFEVRSAAAEMVESLLTGDVAFAARRFAERRTAAAT